MTLRDEVIDLRAELEIAKKRLKEQEEIQKDVLQTIQEQKEEQSQCIICMEAPRSHAIVPCGHQCVCSACAAQLPKITEENREEKTKREIVVCPVCRSEV